MSYDLTKLCPICIENPIKYYTECNHGYCIGCLCRIKKCAMCRKSLQRANICIQIKQKVIIIQPYRNNSEYFHTITTTISRHGDLRANISVNLPDRFSTREESYFNTVSPVINPGQGIHIFSIGFIRDEYVPSGI